MLPPITADNSGPLPVASSRVSAPPGVADTGTASPWTGTHGGARPKSPATTIALGVALAAILVGAGIFAKVRDDRQQASARAIAAAKAIQAPHPAATLTPAPAVPGVEAAPSTVATILGASPMTPPPPVTGVPTVEPAPTARRAPVTGPPRTKTATTRPRRAGDAEERERHPGHPRLNDRGFRVLMSGGSREDTRE